MKQIKLFTTIAIEIASKCNRTCHFCPNAYFKREDVFMPMETLEKILNNLAALKYKGRVEFYIYNEPTRDKRLPEIIKMFRSKLSRSSFMVNTNGDYFKSANDIKLLFDCGLNQMQIN